MERDGKLYGDTEPRIFTPPLAELTRENSLGFEVIDFAREILGIELRPWQEWFFIHALELDPEKDYQDFRFRQLILLVGRQNGKTLVMVILGLWKLFIDGCSEIVTAAQDLSVAEATLSNAFMLAKANPDLNQWLPWRMERGEMVPFMRTANGSNQIELAYAPVPEALDVFGAMPKWFVVATNRGGGRSHSAELAMLDELREHTDFQSWGAITPAVAERPRNQVYGFSNAGDEKSVVLRKQRNICLKEISDGITDQSQLAIFEWSAPEDCSIFDRDGWAAANPSLGYGNRDEKTMLSLARAALDPEDDEADENLFRIEYLCQWVKTLEQGKVKRDTWDALKDSDSRRDEDAPIEVAVDVDVDGRSSSVTIASYREDGHVHLETVAHRTGYHWVAGWLRARLSTWFSGTVGIQVKGSPSADLANLLEKDGDFTVRPWQGSDMSGSTTAFYASIQAGEIRHLGQPILDEAAVGIRERRVGDIFIWDRDKSTAPASAFVSANIAWWMLKHPQDLPVSAYSSEDYAPVNPPGEDVDREPAHMTMYDY